MISEVKKRELGIAMVMASPIYVAFYTFEEGLGFTIFCIGLVLSYHTGTKILKRSWSMISEVKKHKRNELLARVVMALGATAVVFIPLCILAYFFGFKTVVFWVFCLLMLIELCTCRGRKERMQKKGAEL